MSQPIRILLADDHVMLRQGTAEILRKETDIEVIGEADKCGGPGHSDRRLEIHTNHLGIIQRFNECQHVSCSGVVDIATRFIRLGLECKLQIIFLVLHIITKKVHRLA